MEPGTVSRFDPIARFVVAGFQSGTIQRYAFAIAAVAVAGALRGGASFLSERALLFPTFYPAVLAATLFGGIRAGIAASVASVVVVWVAFMARHSLLDIPDADQLFNMSFFGAMALLLVWIAASYRGLIERLRAEDDRRNLMVMEMQHRNRNTLAVAQAIVSQGLKDDRDAAKDINGRLGALAKANQLLLTTPEMTVPFEDIVRSALSSYDPSRYAVSGYPLVLRDNQARNMGLILHELTTNAAKYGALSSTAGTVLISCAKDEGAVTVVWQEDGGPAIHPPASQGFGTRFIDRLLSDLRATAERSYHPNGFVFKLRLDSSGPTAA
ncbi:MAG: sensor histidine kinase [Hyphomicrobiaceae bacterium]|nr:sensor histidine kinase [Hyphomicrobiaceae bacterium]